MWNEIGSMHWGWMGFGAIHMLLFWGFLILAIIFLARLLNGSDERKTTPTDNALEALKLRYANGEIDKEEFEERKRVLQI